MKIIFFPSDNSATSGAFLSMVRLERILEEKYHVKTITVLPEEGDGESLLRNNGLQYVLISSWNWVISSSDKTLDKLTALLKSRFKMMLNRISKKRIVRFLKAENPDIVHINTIYSYIGAEASNKLNIPVVWHIREVLTGEWVNLKIARPKRNYKLINKSSRIIAISDYVKDIYIKELKNPTITRIYNGINPETQKIGEKNIFSGNTINLLIVGHIAEHKGQKEAIEAFIVARKKINNLRLNIVGSGDKNYICALRDLIKKWDLEDEIKFLGKKTSDELSHIYANNDIVLVCSRAEPFGRITAEGMMSGCLVIAADTGACPELIGNGKYGLLYSQGDSNDLAKKIITACIDKENTRIVAKKGQEFALKEFIDTENANQIYKLYREILTGDNNG